MISRLQAPAADDGFGGFEDAGFGGFDEGSTAAPAPPEDDMDGFGDDFEDPAPAAAAAAADPAADPAGGGGGGGGGDDEEFDEWDGFGEEEEDVYKAAASGQNIQSTNFVYSDANEVPPHTHTHTPLPPPPQCTEIPTATLLAVPVCHQLTRGAFVSAFWGIFVAFCVFWGGLGGTLRMTT